MLYKERKLRTGNFSRYELLYADHLIDMFDKGLVDAEENTTLLSFLTMALHCDTVRVFKKMVQNRPKFEQEAAKSYKGRTLPANSHPDYEWMKRLFRSKRESYVVTIKQRWQKVGLDFGCSLDMN